MSQSADYVRAEPYQGDTELAADDEVELEHIAQACDDDEDDYVTTDEGVLLFFERLHHGWKLGRDGKLHPPKAPNLADLNMNAQFDGSGCD